jgi:hypothetical protein
MVPTEIVDAYECIDRFDESALLDVVKRIEHRLDALQPEAVTPTTPTTSMSTMPSGAGHS